MAHPEAIDPIQLEIWWSRLAAFTDEAATTLLHTAFSTIIRESNDYTVVLMNRSGETIAECRAGIPAFAALMSPLTQHLLARFPAETWQEGDRVITNDPRIALGHLPDVAMVCPIFYQGQLVGFSGTAAHLPDIGGSPSMGRTELISEGLLIPPLHLYRGDVLNDGVSGLILSNVRIPHQVWGDIEAQIAANEVCRTRAIEFLDDTQEPDFEALSKAIHQTTDRAMRRAVAKIPDGTYRACVDADGVEDRTTHIECAVTITGDEIAIDYTGTSPQVDFATNCPLTYTTAYSMYPLKLLLAPHTRSNHGSYRCFSVTAPSGTIVNPSFPAPVLARHLTGHLLSCAIYQALADVLPLAVTADSGGAPAFRVQFAGKRDDGEDFSLILFASAGMGASARGDGLSTTAFPTNSGGGSIEALEASAPLLFLRKEYRIDSGGPGQHRGGLGQDIEVQNATGSPIRVVLLGDREHHPAQGIQGGKEGIGARAVFSDGSTPALKSMSQLPSESSVTLSFAGGGGYGSPNDRDQAAIADDLQLGFISAAAAREAYGHRHDDISGEA